MFSTVSLDVELKHEIQYYGVWSVNIKKIKTSFQTWKIIKVEDCI